MSSYFTHTDELRTESSPSSFSPYQKFMYALNSKESKRQYPKRLQIFLNFINIKSDSIEENCNSFYDVIKKKGDDI
jgi:hypothetical protein